MPDPKIAAKRALAALCSLRPRWQARDVVLLYHSVGAGPVALPQAEFARQIDWLQATGVLVSLSELLSQTGRGKPRVALTFDDGYSSLYTSAMPVLAGSAAKPAAFLTTGWIGTAERRASAPEQGHYPGEQFLLWREVDELATAGWEIGSHGVDHLDLTAQQDERVMSELCNSRTQIARELGACLSIFAYTWGRHTSRLRRRVAEAGYTHALAGVHGAVTKDSDRFAVPRIDIGRNYSLADFKAIVLGDWDYLGWYQQKRLAWRTQT